MPRAPKLQRWLDLIAFLSERHYGVSIEQVMEGVPAYARRWRSEDPKARASVRRMFERDKDELRGLGIPIEQVGPSGAGGSEEETGYRLRSRDFYLPYLRLVQGAGGAGASGARRRDPSARTGDSLEIDEEEAAAAIEGLAHLGRLPDFPLAREARSAYRKLTFDVDPARFSPTPLTILPAPGESDLEDATRVLGEAVLRRKRVAFLYRGIRRGETTRRDVAPYGLLYRQGHWYLIGHDALREGVRVFRVSRMDALAVNAARPHTPDFPVPADFDIGDYADRRAWELGGGDERPLAVRVLFRFPASLWAERNGLGELVEERPDGSSVRSFEVPDPAPFLRWLLSLEGEAEVQLPAELRGEARRMAQAAAAAHGGFADE